MNTYWQALLRLGIFMLLMLGLASLISNLPPLIQPFMLAILIFLFLGATKYIQSVTVRPVQLIQEGKYEEALARLSQGLKKNLFVKLKLIDKRVIMVNMIAAYTRLGEFAASMQHLEKLEKLGLTEYYQRFYEEAYMLNLLLLGQDLNQVEAWLEKQKSLLSKPNYVYLYSSYLNIKKGNLEGAAQQIKNYADEKEKSKGVFYIGSTKFTTDHEYLIAVENFYLGVYYQAIGDIKKAKDCLFNAALFPYKNFYKTKATEILNELEA